jgi:hypothetical protein
MRLDSAALWLPCLAVVLFELLFGGAAEISLGFGLGVLFVFHVGWESLHDSTARANSLRKVTMLGQALAHLALSRDKKWSKKKLPEPDLIKGLPANKSVRIVFVRHGESIWNEIFNKGKAKLLPRLFLALLREGFMWPSEDSIFFDSPLNDEGIAQARKLHGFVEKEWLAAGAPPPQDPKKAHRQEMLDILTGAPGAPSSILVASNLRRAIQTLVVAVWGRLCRSGEKIHVLSSLQEVTFNVDGLGLAKRKEIPEMGGIGGVPELQGAFGADAKQGTVSRCFDANLQFGSKPLFGTNGLKRMLAFCEWASKRKENTIIIGGHSLWFRSFFRTFLPSSAKEHVAYRKKMVNCGVVSFTLHFGSKDGKKIHRIDPDSICSITGGFEGK